MDSNVKLIVLWLVEGRSVSAEFSGCPKFGKSVPTLKIRQDAKSSEFTAGQWVLATNKMVSNNELTNSHLIKHTLR